MLQTTPNESVQLTARHRRTPPAAAEDPAPAGIETHRATTEESAYTAAGGSGDGPDNGARAETATGESAGTESREAATVRAGIAGPEAVAATAQREISVKGNDTGGGPAQRLGHQHRKRHNCKELTAKQAEWDR